MDFARKSPGSMLMWMIDPSSQVSGPNYNLYLSTVAQQVLTVHLCLRNPPDPPRIKYLFTFSATGMGPQTSYKWG